MALLGAVPVNGDGAFAFLHLDFLARARQNWSMGGSIRRFAPVLPLDTDLGRRGS